MNSSVFPRLRFACKLSLAVVLSLVLGFWFEMETPRWAALTAAIVAAGPAFVAGGDPFSGAIRHRGLLRILGTFIGCFGALVIIMTTVRAPVVMLMLCCLWAGVCVWISSLVKTENSYVFALAGYTALIIIITSQSSPRAIPQFAIERCSEIILGIVCVILADLVFSPRSVKQDVDRAIDDLLLGQYQLLQRCVGRAATDDVDSCWHGLLRKTQAIGGMRNILLMESSHWQPAWRRMKTLLSQSWMMMTLAGEIGLMRRDGDCVVKGGLLMLLEQPVTTPGDLRRQLRQLRHLAASHSSRLPAPLVGWLAASSRYQLLAAGIRTNARISQRETEILEAETPVRASSAETHHALINGLRTGVATAVGCLFWLLTGWTSGSVCMVMLGVVTALVMRLPNPLMAAKDFLIGTLIALPLGAVMFMLVLPATQQSLLLLGLCIGVMTFVIGIEIQKRRLGSLGALASTINILVLDNPMTFNLSQFLDNAIGQIIGCVLALAVIMLIRDNSRARTGRTLLNRLVHGAIDGLSTRPARCRENHLPALYQHLFLLINLFPGDMAKYRLALSLIIVHQRLRQLDIPLSDTLAECHRQMRATAARVAGAAGDTQRSRYFSQLLTQMEEYRQHLGEHQVADDIVAAVARLTALLQRHQHALCD
ncbi:p-hydroxybenzoic acid efflux pump subunit AaeB [Musicola paradisiaca]|uniref:p-hydroxybenzoic acid efflux pump subunit AaeB n=1 Tax=Musicola paradisiaca (strain Ech703) TaxID=579405 RepID=AAEB_MUSP7|nr:p-hydroxybenzoic acid efflux pump subunit AaeB [Musicola paradisiaca]C6C4L7.1 RecName: Full=p-hydroxybenzoic acid efflux pump subunit AaeB; Short=pHBA efflux pump protein B [Musicola paradisiaca Ech703]ACS87424.1 Fusaric acid resistance protein conserved region [Musicola paradisiaca Ech703]